jgi:hypothetical protein
MKLPAPTIALIGFLASIGLLAVGVATGAFAQDAEAPKPAPEKTAPAAPVAPPSEYLVRLSPADLNSIGQALMELPKKVADPIVDRINAQLIEQNKAAAEKK